MPRTAFRDRAGQDMSRDARDEPGVFRQGHERRWRDVTAARMLPAGERLEAEWRAGAHVDGGLEDDRETAARHDILQLREEGHAFGAFRVGTGVVDGDPITTRGRIGQGDLTAPQQGRGIHRVIGLDGDGEIRGRKEWPSDDIERCRERGLEIPGQS